MEFNLPTILSIVTLITVGYNVFIGLRKPNEDQNLAISLLKEQVKGYEVNTATLIKTYQNDLHSVQGSVKDLDVRMNELNRALSVLTNIIEERLPHK